MRIGVAKPSPDEYEEEGTGESPPDTARYDDEAKLKTESENF